MTCRTHTQDSLTAKSVPFIHATLPPGVTFHLLAHLGQVNAKLLKKSAESLGSVSEALTSPIHLLCFQW